MTATLDWMGCATFRLTLDEQVVMLDAYIDRVPSAALRIPSRSSRAGLYERISSFCLTRLRSTEAKNMFCQRVSGVEKQKSRQINRGFLWACSTS